MIAKFIAQLALIEPLIARATSATTLTGHVTLNAAHRINQEQYWQQEICTYNHVVSHNGIRDGGQQR